MLAILTGIIAGMIHVWAGPDHLTAIAPLAADSKKMSWMAGVKWGIGHSLGVGVVGGLALLLREILPLESISGWSERIIGVMLIGIGIWGLRKAFKTRIHTHTHHHNNSIHTHIHVHPHPEEHEKPAAHIHMHAALGIGILHGFAGSSHFLGVLPALAFPKISQTISYIIAFGAGTIISMALFAFIVGILSEKFSFGSGRAYKWFMASCSGAALCVGFVWLLY